MKRQLLENEFKCLEFLPLKNLRNEQNNQSSEAFLVSICPFRHMFFCPKADDLVAAYNMEASRRNSSSEVGSHLSLGYRCSTVQVQFLQRLLEEYQGDSKVETGFGLFFFTHCE